MKSLASLLTFAFFAEHAGAAVTTYEGDSVASL